MDVITATDLRTHTALQLDLVQHKGEGLLVTRGGKAAGLLLPLDLADVPVIIGSLKESLERSKGPVRARAELLRKTLEAMEGTL